MVRKIVKRISKGTRFNQIYLQKNEGLGFETGKNVIIMPLEEAIEEEPSIFEYNVKLESLKKEIIKEIFKCVNEEGDSDNIIITGSFLNKGFNFEDIDIVIVNPSKIDEYSLKYMIEERIGADTHLILIESESLNRGIRRDPLFRLMTERFVATKRTIFRKERDTNYKLLDIHLLRNKNLIEGYDLLNIRQRKKLLRDFVSIKLFSENKEVTIKSIEKETEKIFGKEIVERIFFHGDKKQEFMKKLKDEFNRVEKRILYNAAKQT